MLSYKSQQDLRIYQIQLSKLTYFYVPFSFKLNACIYLNCSTFCLVRTYFSYYNMLFFNLDIRVLNQLLQKFSQVFIDYIMNYKCFMFSFQYMFYKSISQTIIGFFNQNSLSYLYIDTNHLIQNRRAYYILHVVYSDIPSQPNLYNVYVHLYHNLKNNRTYNCRIPMGTIVHPLLLFFLYCYKSMFIKTNWTTNICDNLLKVFQSSLPDVLTYNLQTYNNLEFKYAL